MLIIIALNLYICFKRVQISNNTTFPPEKKQAETYAITYKSKKDNTTQENIQTKKLHEKFF